MRHFTWPPFGLLGTCNDPPWSQDFNVWMCGLEVVGKSGMGG